MGRTRRSERPQGNGDAVAAVFGPVETPTMFEETVERLGTAIRLGLLSPGSRLPPERELAEQLGISRTTLRQAITTLVQSGHLESVRGRGGGTFVSAEPPLTTGAGELRRDWRDVLANRLAVELGATALASNAIRDDELTRLRGLVSEMEASREFEQYRRLDVRFHIALAEATRSPRVVAAMTEAQGELSELIALIAHPRAVLARANAQHARLVDALERRDTGKALEIMLEHLEGTEHVLAGLMPADAIGWR